MINTKWFEVYFCHQMAYLGFFVLFNQLSSRQNSAEFSSALTDLISINIHLLGLTAQNHDVQDMTPQEMRKVLALLPDSMAATVSGLLLQRDISLVEDDLSPGPIGIAALEALDALSIQMDLASSPFKGLNIQDKAALLGALPASMAAEILGSLLALRLLACAYQGPAIHSVFLISQRMNSLRITEWKGFVFKGLFPPQGSYFLDV